MTAPTAERPYLSVVIPTFKEAARLPRTLDEIRPYLQRRFPRHEVLVVDDNSPDGTGAAALAASAPDFPVRVLTQPGRLGKGAALRRGCLAAKGELVLFMDADHSTPIEEVDAFVESIERHGVGAVVGVRTYQEDESRSRRIIGLVAQLLAHLLVFKKAVVDSQCGFKLFSAAVVQRIFPLARVDGGMIDVELFYLMHKHAVPCRYVPVHWANKPGSRINLLVCAIRDPIDMLRIRLRDFLGRYEKPVRAGRQPWEAAG